MTHTEQALARLKAGNRRFVNGQSTQSAQTHLSRRPTLQAGQAPFAIILSCADSRVPPEIIFDEGLGDLFVIRVAGNVVSPTVIGSIEFAVEKLGTRLIVVLGHSQCGAVQIVLNTLAKPAPATLSPGLQAIFNAIEPVVTPLWLTHNQQLTTGLVADAVQANVVAVVQQLGKQSAILQQHLQNSTVKIVGGVYALETGVVDFGPADRTHNNPTS